MLIAPCPHAPAMSSFRAIQLYFGRGGWRPERLGFQLEGTSSESTICPAGARVYYLNSKPCERVWREREWVRVLCREVKVKVELSAIASLLSLNHFSSRAVRKLDASWMWLDPDEESSSGSEWPTPTRSATTYSYISTYIVERVSAFATYEVFVLWVCGSRVDRVDCVQMKCVTRCVWELRIAILFLHSRWPLAPRLRIANRQLRTRRLPRGARAQVGRTMNSEYELMSSSPHWIPDGLWMNPRENTDVFAWPTRPYITWGLEVYCWEAVMGGGTR